MNEKTISGIQKELFDLWESMEGIYDQVLARWELSYNSFSVLYSLQKNPEGLEPSRLAELVGVSRQIMTILLNELEERGFILRKNQKEDRRRRRILLSRPGIRFADEVLQAVNALDGRVLSTFTEPDAQMLLELTRRYCAALKTAANELPIV